MKTKVITALILFQVVFLYAQNINPAWRHIGPYSENGIASNWFRSGQIDDMTVDPGDPEHIIVSSFFAGLLEISKFKNL